MSQEFEGEIYQGISKGQEYSSQAVRGVGVVLVTIGRAIEAWRDKVTYEIDDQGSIRTRITPGLRIRFGGGLPKGPRSPK